MLCRTRRRGLEVEGLGIVFLEAAAAGLPLLVGDSGGLPDAVHDGETRHVVNGRSLAVVAARLIAMLTDPGAARAMGEKGRAWVAAEWDWARSCEEWCCCWSGSRERARDIGQFARTLRRRPRPHTVARGHRGRGPWYRHHPWHQQWPSHRRAPWPLRRRAPGLHRLLAAPVRSS
ncbi:glycosyltransferase [Streptomyces sp. RGM 3693]|uniref:glycosyltransferase n=1 Tax=Streptomyces sp. RGM 3693 TaxID=3413284 RepID=UPI003D2D23FE